MSVSLFEIQRIWDAWPNIKNQQVLRDLFRQQFFNSSGQELKISKVFVIPGHIFIAVASKNGRSRASLYVFSSVPLSECARSPRDSHVTTACLLELSYQCTEVLNVIDDSKDNGEQRVYVVQNNGELVTYVYNPMNHNWTFNESYQLTKKSNSTVYSCCFTSHPNSTRHTSHVFLYCARSSSSPSQSSYNFEVVMKRCDIAPNGSFIMGQSSILLDSCPPFELASFNDGVCFIPTQKPYPMGLILFWAPAGGEAESNSMRAYVWNVTTPTPSPYDFTSPISPLNFKSIILRLASTWSKVVQEPNLVSLTTHPVTKQLLALDSNGGIHSLGLAITGTIKRTHLITLSDCPHCSASTPSLFSFPPSFSQLQLFCLYTYYGVVINGDIRLYDSFSGEFLWESNEHEGAGFQFWTMSKFPGCCGLYGNSGMWIIRSQKCSDHACFMARGIFPVQTNADETTPGEYLPDGQLIAARLCKLWGLHLLSTKYALEAAYDTMKQADESVEESDSYTPTIPLEIISLLDENSSLQNPSLLVALLAEFPAYRQELTNRVERFLNDYHSNTPEKHVNSLMTPLNKELVPLFEKYLELSKESEQLLKEESNKDFNSSNVRMTVCEILKKSEHQSAIGTNESLRPQLHSLCECYPEEALSGIKDFFGIINFHDAVEQLKSEQWKSQRNWKDIFATEIAVRVEKSYLKASVEHIPLFEETCRLLYQSHPEDLLAFVSFAQLARDHQAQGDSAFARKCRKDLFYHRAINALPIFVSRESTPTKPESIRVYCQLLLNSDHQNSEMMSLQLLLDNHLWEDAIELVEEMNKDNRSFLFYCLLNGLSKGGVLNCYIDRAWKLLPSKFSVFDFLNILGNGSHPTDELFAKESSSLTVSSIAPKILNLLEQATMHVGNS